MVWSLPIDCLHRATLLSASVLGCYSETKEQLHKRFPAVFPNKDGELLMFCSTMFASLVANAVSNPFDVVKSRVQVPPFPFAFSFAFPFCFLVLVLVFCLFLGPFLFLFLVVVLFLVLSYTTSDTMPYL